MSKITKEQILKSRLIDSTIYGMSLDSWVDALNAFLGSEHSFLILDLEEKRFYGSDTASGICFTPEHLEAIFSL